MWINRGGEATVPMWKSQTSARRTVGRKRLIYLYLPNRLTFLFARNGNFVLKLPHLSKIQYLGWSSLKWESRHTARGISAEFGLMDFVLVWRRNGVVKS